MLKPLECPHCKEKILTLWGKFSMEYGECLKCKNCHHAIATSPAGYYIHVYYLCFIASNLFDATEKILHFPRTNIVEITISILLVSIFNIMAPMTYKISLIENGYLNPNLDDAKEEGVMFFLIFCLFCYFLGYLE